MISLGVDIGGTGIKCVAFHEDGRQLAVHYIEYPNPAGGVNLDPRVLSDTVFQVIARCVSALDNKDAVAAVTVSSFGESFVPLDDKGDPLSDIIMYFADTRTREFYDLVEVIGEETLMRVTGTKPDSFYSLSKMLYTRRTVQKPVWKYLLISSYICYCLSGETVIDVPLACRTLLFDVSRRAWSEELLQATGFRKDQLPEVVPPGSVAGKIKPDLAHRLGLPPNTLVVIGAHDQVVNALACGVAKEGDAADVSGTVECIVPLFQKMPEGLSFQQRNYACIPYPGGRGYVTYAYNLSGGSVIRWFRDNFAQHLKDEARAEDVSVYDLFNRQAPGEPGNLLFLPYLQGMGGTPMILPDARGMLYGLDMKTGLWDVYRAILEGLSFEMACNLDSLADYGIAPRRLFACGGGARSRIWLSIKADIWNRPVIPVLTEETGALGSAVLGFAAVTGEGDLFALAQRFIRHGEPIMPNPGRAQIYAEKQAKYRRFRDFIIQENTQKEGAAQ